MAPFLTQFLDLVVFVHHILVLFMMRLFGLSIKRAIGKDSDVEIRHDKKRN